MKKVLLFLLLVGMVSLAQAGATSTVLFSDSYDRADATDIDASSTGMSGTLSPLAYDEAFEGSGNATSIQILSNELDIAVGVGMSSLYLEHNFTDTAITDTDGFSVSLDVVAITSADDQLNRFGGFGVGNTLAEAQAAADCYDSPATSFRPAVHLAGTAVSDFYVDLALDQNLRLWSNGTVLNTINVGAASGTISVDFLVPDFNAGSEVTAVVYFDGVMQDVQTFTWDNASANYIGISGRTAGAGVFLDNLEIATIYNDHAELVSPAEPPYLVPAAGGTLDLQWTKGKDASGNPNADINYHYVHVTDQIIDGDPNFAASTADHYTVEDPATSQTITVDYDQIKYWRVDESVPVTGGDSGMYDPNTITGFVWQFETQKSVPVITGDLTDVMRHPYTDTENYEGSAVFTCIFDSINAVDVKWYRGSDPVNPIVSGGDVTIALTPADGIGTGSAATLTIVDVEGADEDTYYCEFELQSAPGEVVEASAIVNLGVYRQVAYWTLDSDVTGYDNGFYVDSTVEGHHAEPNALPDAGNVTHFPAGVDAVKTNEALNIAANPLFAADSGVWNPALYTGEMTISAWVNWQGVNGSIQGVVCGRNNEAGVNGWFFEISGGQLQANAPGYNAFSTPMPTDPGWTHIALVAGGGTGTIYINGLEAESSNNYAVNRVEVPVYLGSTGRPNDTLTEILNGSLDDVQIFNYAMTDEDIINEFYNAILEESVCLYPNDTFDLANAETGLNVDDEDFTGGDCIVNIADFAVFASHWLECGYYPDCPY